MHRFPLHSGLACEAQHSPIPTHATEPSPLSAPTVVPPELCQHAPQLAPVVPVPPDVVHCTGRAGSQRSAAGTSGFALDKASRRGMIAPHSIHPSAVAGATAAAWPRQVDVGVPPARYRPSTCAAPLGRPDVQVAPLAVKDVHQTLDLRDGGRGAGWWVGSCVCISVCKCVHVCVRVCARRPDHKHGARGRGAAKEVRMG